MSVEIKHEVNGFKTGDIVISKKAAAPNQTPHEIVWFVCWGYGRIHTRLKNCKYKWGIDSLQHYNKTH